jgi:ribonuclease T2
MPRPSLACLLPFALLTVLCARPAAAWEQDRPGRFDYYILVLGWSPSYCEGEGAQRHDRQCDTDKPGGFVRFGRNT